MFQRIDNIINGQIAELKADLETSILKDKWGIRNHMMLYKLNEKISHKQLRSFLVRLEGREIVMMILQHTNAITDDLMDYHVLVSYLNVLRS